MPTPRHGRKREAFGERMARLDAERKARATAHAKKAAAARWKGGKGPASKSVRLYVEDLPILRHFGPWDGRKVFPAVAVHRLLAASQGLLWRYDDRGGVVPTGPLRDACRQPPPSAPAE